MNQLYHSTIESLAMAIDAKDAKTHGHIQRVQGLTLKLAEFCGVKDHDLIEGLRAASLLHDIGKLAISEYILNKPSPLTEWEVAKIRRHPNIGADILSSVPFPYPVVPYVRYHHERWDGTGYPAGLKGEEIPLGARILSIADCYDALRSDRPYRAALSPEVALQHIVSESGQSYDPSVVAQLVAHHQELESLIQESEAIEQATRISRELAETASGGSHPRSPSTVFQEIGSTHQEIQTLYEISQALGKSLNLEVMLTILADKVRKVIPYSSCSIYLVNPERGTLTVCHTAGRHSDLLARVSLNVGQGVSGWVAANGQHLLNVSPSPDFMDSEVLREAYRTCLVMPLIVKEGVIGIMSLYSDHSGSYTHDHLRFMETLSDHVAAALKNALVYQETEENAFTDLLTGLPNLRYFGVVMEEKLSRAKRQNRPITLLMMDVDSFKTVNDQFGHKVGDRILTEIAGILRGQLRESDTCIRYAGDEFVAVLPGVGKSQSKRAIGRIQEVLDEQDLVIDPEHSVRLGISIGAATFPDDGQDAELLLVAADQEMYKNKLQRSRSRKYPEGVVPIEHGAKKSS